MPRFTVKNCKAFCSKNELFHLPSEMCFSLHPLLHPLPQFILDENAAFYTLCGCNPIQREGLQLQPRLIVIQWGTLAGKSHQTAFTITSGRISHVCCLILRSSRRRSTTTSFVADERSWCGREAWQRRGSRMFTRKHDVCHRGLLMVRLRKGSEVSWCQNASVSVALWAGFFSMQNVPQGHKENVWSGSIWTHHTIEHFSSF